jgi:hypothetical protein
MNWQDATIQIASLVTIVVCLLLLAAPDSVIENLRWTLMTR